MESSTASTLAPGGQGTDIHVVLYGSQLEKPAATLRWLRRLPEGLLFDQLHRFKQLIELGEITQVCIAATVTTGEVGRSYARATDGPQRGAALRRH